MLATSISVLHFVDLADNLLTTLISHQAIPDCHSWIMAVMKGKDDPCYMKTTMVHLRDVELVNQDVWLLQSIVPPLLCVRDPHQEVVRMILQSLTEFVWRQPGNVRGLGIFDDNLSKFLNDGNANQATTHMLVDFVTTCWAKNRTEYEAYFTGMTDWFLRSRVVSGFLLALSAIIAHGGKPADLAVELTRKFGEWSNVSPVTAKKIVDYMQERTKDSRAE
jgi:hypothetical protein